VTVSPRRVLYVIACGGPPAGQVADFVRVAQPLGWDVAVVATPDGAKFLDAEQLAELTGHPVRVSYKQPGEADVLPPADAMVVAPATFSTVNKLACGISDTLAMGLLNEAIGMGLPIIVVPWPNVHLARHPAFHRSVRELRDWGLTVLYDPVNVPGRDGDPAAFPWEELAAELGKLRVLAGSGENAAGSGRS
jgi:phosphopantothenoylcysteine synthetase/decarboxylase